MKEIPPLNPPLNQCWIFCKISEAATQSAAKYQTQVIIDAIAGSLSIQHQDLQKLHRTKIPQKSLSGVNFVLDLFYFASIFCCTFKPSIQTWLGRGKFSLEIVISGAAAKNVSTSTR